MPSFVPVMRMLALGSSGRGMAILVAVFSSSSCSFSPFLPITKRWCSFGMATVAEAWREEGTGVFEIDRHGNAEGGKWQHSQWSRTHKQPGRDFINIFTHRFLQLLLVSVVLQSL